MAAQDADIAEEIRPPVAAGADSDQLQVQPGAFLLELSLDWIVLRASENVDDYLGESHVTLVDEPLSRFVQAQALHDLRNLFSRLSGSTGVAKAYRVRLTDDRPRYDIAFQVSDGRVLLEGAASPERGLGSAIGSVGGLADGLSVYRGQALLDASARRVRALTGCDRSLIVYRGEAGERIASSIRGGSGESSLIPDLPAILCDSQASAIAVFPRKPGDESIAGALLRSPSEQTLRKLGEQEVRSAISVPMVFEGKDAGMIQCLSRSPRAPNLELHSAAELFAELLVLRLEIDRLRG